MSKIQFWKQITTTCIFILFMYLLFSICQRYNFESKSQLETMNSPTTKNCFRYVKDTILKANHNLKSALIQWTIYVKDTILKANHNHYHLILFSDRTVFDMSKIQFWKQITTNRIITPETSRLFSICQRYNFESKSQLELWLRDITYNCFRYVKDTILKANHNRFRDGKSYFCTVFDMSKIQFWKQITTIII